MDKFFPFGLLKVVVGKFLIVEPEAVRERVVEVCPGGNGYGNGKTTLVGATN